MSFSNSLWGQDSIDTHEWLPHEAPLNLIDMVEDWTTGIVLEWNPAPSIIHLPTWAFAKKFGTFEDFTAAIMWDNPTYDLQTNEHIG